MYIYINMRVCIYQKKHTSHLYEYIKALYEPGSLSCAPLAYVSRITSYPYPRHMHLTYDPQHQHAYVHHASRHLIECMQALVLLGARNL